MSSLNYLLLNWKIQQEQAKKKPLKFFFLENNCLYNRWYGLGLEVGAQGSRYNVKQESVSIHGLEKLDRPNVCITKRNTLTHEETEQALQLLDLAQPKNPCFISFLPPGSVYNRCHLVSSAVSPITRTMPNACTRTHILTLHDTVWIRVNFEVRPHVLYE